MATVKHPQFRAGASGPEDPGYRGEAVLNEEGASGDVVAFIPPNASEAEAAEALAMAGTDQDQGNRPPPEGGSGDPHLEAENSTVDDWFGQRAARDADLADDLMDETGGDERKAEQLFNEESEGASDRGDSTRRSDPEAPGTGVNTPESPVAEPNEPA